MKLIICILVWLIASPAFGATFKTVMKNESGTMGAAGGVTAFVTKGGVTVFDVSAGVNVLRTYYVSNNAAITDHGDSSVEGSLAYIIDAAGTAGTDVVLMGGTTYSLITGTTVPANINLIFGSGAVIDISNTSTGLTVYGSIVAQADTIFTGAGASVFGQSATSGFFYGGWNNAASSASGYGLGRQPRAGYKLDVDGTISSVASVSLPFTSITGTATNSQLPDPITVGVATTETITGRSKHINLTSATLYTLDISGTSGVYVSAVTDASRSPTSGVSIVLQSPPAGGYDVVFIMENSTYEQGTTTYVHFTANDVVASADTIIAGTSKFILSGTTDSMSIFCHSTGVSRWWVRTSGSPSVDWD